ncbi:ABC transporter permease [Afifella marina DSM 2698]|uniref:Putative ABC transport system substrate-binding protein n=1 Tax=Afifella marina DSM 2698 TaxID=1120955 RepID=A0A1G5N337_AFIMA|nr:ABC transporter substrate-binding protein [Afifella marina]MBK1622380.1 ABC transporter permease [Afifella marina DSM 2698]MBK1626906.1 ABC transporter permease [Afifella marina]MBK5919164.1 ABC transporter permease [Afifella marina]RAI21373.1 ABC transporter permease [Afifella marina DSM 2698]SCZ31783.1 putative ABC transport system substrate-binding protein [Afifella marina DSM 2698]
MQTFKALALAALALGIAGAATVDESKAQDTKTVAITYIVEHPALDAVRKGIIEGLAERGYKEGENLKIVSRSAQGNMATQAQIASEFAGLEPDLAVGISTPSAQAVKHALKNTPVIFAAVTDPVGAGLVESREKPGGLVTGTSDQQPYEPMLELIKELMPDAKKLGVIYNPGEANAAKQVEDLKTAVEPFGMTLVEAPAAQSTLVADAARSLVGRADAVLLPVDNTVVSVLEGVVMVGERAGLPVFASDVDSVNRGALAALGFDYYKMGVLSGEMAADILDGKSPADIPVAVSDSQDLYLNVSSAEKMGVTIPDDMLAKAKKVVR